MLAIVPTTREQGQELDERVQGDLFDHLKQCDHSSPDQHVNLSRASSCREFVFFRQLVRRPCGTKPQSALYNGMSSDSQFVMGALLAASLESFIFIGQSPRCPLYPSAPSSKAKAQRSKEFVSPSYCHGFIPSILCFGAQHGSCVSVVP